MLITRPVSYTHLDVYKRQVNGSTEELINMSFAVIVLASDTAHRYLVALGRGVEPRLLDLINGHLSLIHIFP